MGYNIGYINETDAYITNPPIEQGSTFELPFTVTLPADLMVHFLEGRVIDGVIDTGTVVRAQYRSPISSNTAVAFTGVISKVSNTTLSCKVSLTSVQTAAMLLRFIIELTED